MTVETKPNLGLTVGWAPGDSGWGDPMNSNLDLLDAIVMLGVISATTLAPPTDPAPAEGDRYIIPTGATGDWSTHIGAVALFQDAAWVYLVPKVGWTARVAGESRLDFDGTNWIDGGSIQEAPEDNTPYARKNGNWVAIGSGGGLPEAPEDDKQYARQNGDWVEVAAAAAALHDLTDVDDSGKAQAVVLTYDTTSSKWIARLIALGALVSYTNFGFDPATAAAGVTVSGADATIPHGSFKNVRGLAPMLSKAYFEIKILALGTYFGMANTIGIGDAASDTASGPAMYNNGGQAAGFAISLGEGATYENGNQWDSAPTGAVGDVFGFAYDPTARKVWYRKNGGVWNVSRSTPGGDPATGANGISISFTMNMIAMAYCQDAVTDAQYEINNGQLPWNATPPSGYVGTATTVAAPSIGLADVMISSPADGDVLTYDFASKKFVNKASSGGGGGGSLASLSDVALGVKANHDLLVYKATGTDWVNAQLFMQAPTAITPSWDSGLKAANMVLSNSSRTAEPSFVTGQPWAGIFGTQKLNYKAYFEFSVGLDGQSIFENFALGVATRALGTATTPMSGTNNSVVLGMDSSVSFSSVMYQNGSRQTATPGSLDNNVVYGIAFDPTTRKVWIRKSAAGLWNDATGTQDPATGAGGIAVGGTDDVYPFFGTVTQSVPVTIVHSSFTGAVPAGFIGLNTPEYVTPGDVVIASPIDGQVMQYDAASGAWKNKGITQGVPNKVPYGAHAYWRVNITSNYGSSTSQRCSELRFFDPSGSQIPTVGGTATASAVTTVDPTLVAANAFDGDPNTFYRSNTAPETTPVFIAYQFTAPVTVASVSYQMTADNILAGAKNFTVQYSDDGSAWTTAWTVTGVASNPYVANTPVAFASSDLVLGTTLRALSDVNLTTLTDGQAIVWDAAQGKFKNGTVASGGGGGAQGNYTAPYRGSLVRLVTPVNNPTLPYLVPWDTMSRDTEGAWSSASPTRLTIPAGKGITKVRFTACLYVNNFAANSGMVLAIRRNSLVNIASEEASQGGYADGALVVKTYVVDVVAGDYFEARLNSSDTSVTVGDPNLAWFEMEIVELSSATNPPYDIPMFFPGVPANSQRMARIRIARAVAISKTAAHLADADAPATAAVTMPLKQNGSAIGTITFAAGSATGAVNFANDVALAAGDTVTWDNQAAADATLGNISVTLLGTRTA